MKEKFKKAKKYLIISSIIWILVLFLNVYIKNKTVNNVINIVLAIDFMINFIIFVIYRLKRKKYRFYKVKTDDKETDIEIKEE